MKNFTNFRNTLEWRMASSNTQTLYPNHLPGVAYGFFQHSNLIPKSFTWGGVWLLLRLKPHTQIIYLGWRMASSKTQISYPNHLSGVAYGFFQDSNLIPKSFTWGGVWLLPRFKPHTQIIYLGWRMASSKT